MAHRLLSVAKSRVCGRATQRVLSPLTARWLSTSNDANNDNTTTKNNTDSAQTFVTPDKEQDNQLDKFAYAIESHPVHDGIVSITGWGEGTFKVDKDVVQERIEDLTLDHFAIFMHANPPLELIILGTGNRLKRPPPKLYQDLMAIAPVEVVDTVNASATFNMLAAEGRYVGAGLIAMGP